MARTYEVTLDAYTRMANHVHLLLQAPPTDPLANGRGDWVSWGKRRSAFTAMLDPSLAHPSIRYRGLAGAILVNL